MSIHLMAVGRLKAPAETRYSCDKRFTTWTLATMIANDSANRSQKIQIETSDETIGRLLKKVKEGETVAVSGEVRIVGTGSLQMRPRTVQRLADAATSEPSERG
jgi:hypothetical protein